MSQIYEENWLSILRYEKSAVNLDANDQKAYFLRDEETVQNMIDTLILSGYIPIKPGLVAQNVLGYTKKGRIVRLEFKDEGDSINVTIRARATNPQAYSSVRTTLCEMATESSRSEHVSILYNGRR